VHRGPVVRASDRENVSSDHTGSASNRSSSTVTAGCAERERQHLHAGWHPCPQVHRAVRVDEAERIDEVIGLSLVRQREVEHPDLTPLDRRIDELLDHAVVRGRKGHFSAVGLALITDGRQSRYAFIFGLISRSNLPNAPPSAAWNGMPVSDSTRRRLR